MPLMVIDFEIWPGMRGISCRSLLQAVCFAAALVGSIGTEQYAAHTLVLGDDLSLATTHSQFLSQLESRGHKVTISKADNASISLTHYGEYVYDNVIIFSPQVEEFGGALDVAEVEASGLDSCLPPPFPQLVLPLTAAEKSSSFASIDARKRRTPHETLPSGRIRVDDRPLSPTSCSSCHLLIAGGT